MVGKRILFAVCFALAGLTTAVITLGDPAPAYAKAKSVSSKLGKPLSEAQVFLNNKQYQETLDKLVETDQISGHSNYDDYVIAEWRGVSYLNLKKYGEAAAEFEKTVNSGEMEKAAANERLKAVVELYYQAGNSAKAQEIFDKYSAANPNDPDLVTLMATASYQNKNYGDAAKYMSQAISAAEAAGKKPDEGWLQILLSSYYNQKNKVAYQATLEKLVRLYPKPEYWSDATLSVLGQPNMPDRRRLAVYRLKMAAGGMLNAGDYVDMIETAQRARLPGDAKAAVDQGYAKGFLGTGGNAARHQRLKSEATSEAASDLKSLAAVESEAKGKTDGDPLVNIGEAWLSHGQYERAATDLKAGLAKGGVSSPEDAKLLLGTAQSGAGQIDQAKATFGGVTGGSAGDVARLWLLYLSTRN